MQQNTAKNKWATFMRREQIIRQAEKRPARSRKLLLEGPLKKSAREEKKELGSLLIIAAYSGDKEELLRLLKKGADPNAETITGWTPLMAAVWNKRHEIAEILLQNRANVNKPDKSGWTAFMLAVQNEDTKMSQLLIAYKADVTLLPPGERLH